MGTGQQRGDILTDCAATPVPGEQMKGKAANKIEVPVLRKFSCDLSIYRLQRNPNISTFVFDPLLELPNLTTTRVPINVTFTTKNWYFGNELLFCFHFVSVSKNV